MQQHRQPRQHMLPAISIATVSTTISIIKRDELGDDHREDEVLVRELHLLDQAGAALHGCRSTTPTEIEKKLNGSRPARK